MIASLNLMAKTFAKIAKTFVGLSTMIVKIRRRPVLILHLEAKYQKWIVKMESLQKTGLGTPGLQKVKLVKS